MMEDIGWRRTWSKWECARIGLTESFAVSYTFSVTTRKCHSHSTIEMLVIELLHETYAEIHAVSWVRPPPVT
jgi:hypothetical protein